MSILTYIIVLPLLGAGIIALIPRNYRFLIRMVAWVATFAALLCAVAAFTKFGGAPVVDGYRFDQKIPWVESVGISYHVGVDGLNLGLVLMGALVAFCSVWVSGAIKSHEKEFYFLLMVMIGGILGAFASLDLFFFYFFHELALIPTFIMIGVWGRGEDKNYATFNITLYLSVGALIALIGLIALYFQTGANTFDIVEMTKYVRANPISGDAQRWIFPLLLFGFGILVSLWPFHTWAPLGYGAAPTATAMLHAGVLKKFGLYGLLRIAIPLMPEAAKSWVNVIAILCLGNILYCGLVAMRQRNLNLLIGNSSVAHMGFVFLGIASMTLVGITGAVLVMVAHGLLAALSFALSGYLHQHAGTLKMDEMGGLLKRLPFIGAALVMAMMAGCGLPGFANFPGEALVLFGSWENFQVPTVLAIWGALVIGAVYMLRAIRTILHGPLAPGMEMVPDAGWSKRVPFILLLGALLAFGFFPRILSDKIAESAKQVLKMTALPNGAAKFAAAPVKSIE
jgi:NADH-quinone oxidoreductase subunit M